MSAPGSAPTLMVVDPASVLGGRALYAYFDDIVGRFWGRSITPAEVRSAVAEFPSDDLVPPSGLFVVAVLDGEPVGCGGVRYLADDIAELTRIHVAVAVRRRGIAAELVRYLEHSAVMSGAGVMRLDVRGDLTEARALYGHLGYREVAPFNDHPYVEHWFEKLLAP